MSNENQSFENTPVSQLASQALPNLNPAPFSSADPSAPGGGGGTGGGGTGGAGSGYSLPYAPRPEGVIKPLHIRLIIALLALILIAQIGGIIFQAVNPSRMGAFTNMPGSIQLQDGAPPTMSGSSGPSLRSSDIDSVTALDPSSQLT